MAFTRNIVNYDKACVFQLVVNTKTLKMSLEGTDVDFKETYESFAKLEAAYRKRVMPYLKKHNCYDIDRECQVDAEQEIDELLAQEGDEPRRSTKTRSTKTGRGALDTLVDGAAQLLRKRLNAAIGLEPCELESAVFVTGDTGIMGVLINCPGLHQVSEDKLQAALKKAGWEGDDFRTKAAWNLEDNPVGGRALEPYGDPYNLYDDCFIQLMHLACAHVEQAPNLRANIKVKAGFRVLIGEAEAPSPDLRLRAAAGEHVGEPAKRFFDAVRDAS